MADRFSFPRGFGERLSARRRAATAVAALLCLIASLSGGCASEATAARDTLRVKLNGRSFDLELALDHETRYRGLSDRESIAEDGGMLFVFPTAAPRQFVMRRCLVPIDVIFLGPTARVVSMHRMRVEPYDRPEHELRRYSSEWPAQFAIELAGGTLDELGLSLGDRVELPTEELKARAR